MTRFSRTTVLWLCLLTQLSQTGCATLFSKRYPKASAADPAVEVVCLWQAGEGRDPDGMPCKGFLGQILFMSAHSSAPVAVEGDVRVYLFDDQGTPEEQAKPLRIFEFDNGSWQIHLGETPLGVTYTVFIPYVRRNVKEASCTLQVRLKPKAGPMVFSDMTNTSLSGHTRAMGADAKPIKKQEVEQTTVEAMSGSLQKFTTVASGTSMSTLQPQPAIPTDVKTGAAPVAPRQAPAAAGTIAGTGAMSTPPEDPRLQRLERMMELLMEQKASSGASRAPSTILPAGYEDGDAAPAVPSEPDTLRPDPSATRLNTRRLRARTAEPEPRSSPARHRHPLDDDSDNEGNSSLWPADDDLN